MFIIISHLYIARYWPKLVNVWCKIDVAMEKNYGYPKNLSKRIKIIATIAVVVSLCKTNLIIYTFCKN